MANPNAPGTRPQLAGDPARGRTLTPPGFVFPAGGVHAPGPMGQIEQPPDLMRSWWPQMVPSLEIGMRRLQASGAGQANLVQVDRPVLLKIVAPESFLQTTTERCLLYATPETPSPYANFTGVEVAHDSLLLSGPGDWIVTARCRTAAGVDQADVVTVVMIDATNPELLRTLLPADTAMTCVSNPDVTLAAGVDQLILSIQEVADSTAILCVNAGANDLRLSFGAVATATNGIPLTAAGTFGDRIMLPSRMLSLQSLHALSASGADLSVTRWS